MSNSKFGSDTPGILAHELGHFVGNILDVPEVRGGGFPTSTREEQLADERQAWKMAKIMYPKLDQKLVEYATGTYETNYQDDPISKLLRLIAAKQRGQI